MSCRCGRHNNDKENAPLAQLVEHLTLNQGVQGSNPWRRIKDTVFADIAIAAGTVFFLYLCGFQGCKANRHGAPFFMSFRSTRALFFVHFLDTYPSVKYCFLLQWFHGRNVHIFLLSRCFHVPQVIYIRLSGLANMVDTVVCCKVAYRSAAWFGDTRIDINFNSLYYNNNQESDDTS